MASAGDMADLLTAPEAEMLIENLKVLELKDIGSPAWLRQHESLEKLNIQAHINASTQTDEFVKEAFISFDKLGMLIYELIEMEMWRTHVKPVLEELDYAKDGTMTQYMVQYHEATVINLLEALLYHRDACESVGDRLLDLVDYCHRAIQFLLSRTPEEVEEEERLTSLPAKDLADMTGAEQLKMQTCMLPFQIAVKAVTLVRYLSDHVTHIPLSCMTRLLNTCDMPVLLVQLVVAPPWVRERDGKLFKYSEGNTWAVVPRHERFQLTKPEAQVWLALYNLLMEPECRRKYEFTTHNKNEVLKLRGHLNDIILDQVPTLTELRRSLEELSLMEPPAPERSVVLEQVPEIRDYLYKLNKGKFTAIAKHQLKKVFRADEATRHMQAKTLADTYNLDMLESMLPEAPVCTVCGEAATSRCSRCQNEWYCRRQCQVEHWPKHKKACDLVSQTKKT